MSVTLQRSAWARDCAKRTLPRVRADPRSSAHRKLGSSTPEVHKQEGVADCEVLKEAFSPLVSREPFLTRPTEDFESLDRCARFKYL